MNFTEAPAGCARLLRAVPRLLSSMSFAELGISRISLFSLGKRRLRLYNVYFLRL